MTNKSILFSSYTPEELILLIQDVINSQLEKHLDPSKRKEQLEYLNIDQAAKFLQLAKQTCYQNINSIPHYKINGKLLFKKSELIKYIESNGNSKKS